MAVILPADVRTHTLAGFSLDQRDADGVVWLVRRLEGWSGADVRVDLQARPGDHGAFNPRPLYGPLSLQLEGRVEAPTLAARRAAERRLSALTNALAGVDLIVDEPPYSSLITVWRAGRLVMTERGATFIYSLPLVAPDPRRYDAAEQAVSIVLATSGGSGLTYPWTFPLNFGAAPVGGDGVAINSGNADTWPVMTLTGPVLNPVVRNNTTGEELRFTFDLPAGSFLTIDTAERTVLLDGSANRRGALNTGSTWPRLIPGANAFQFRGDSYSANASLVIRFRSASL